MTTLTPEELITTLEATSQFNDNADICMEDIIATLQAQAERIKELEMEAELELAAARLDTGHRHLEALRFACWREKQTEMVVDRAWAQFKTAMRFNAGDKPPTVGLD